MDPRTIAAHRLANQALLGSSFEAPEDVVASMVAIQAQEYPLARWSVAQRATGLDDAAVERAITEGSVLRTHVLRPTWHFVYRRDIRWLLDLTAPRVRNVLATYDRKLGIDAALRARSAEVFVRALEGGRQLTRKELAAALQAAGIEAAGQKLGHLVMHAELDGLICSGAVRGKQHTYALLAERAPDARLLSREEALAELAQRFFASHGPATLKDFQWWSSLTAADARRALALAGGNVQTIQAGGRTYYASPDLDPGPPPPGPLAHLLQCYDEFVIAYSESRDVLDAAGLSNVPAGIGAWDRLLVHPLVIDGQVAGLWRRTQAAKSITLDMRLLRPLATPESAALNTELHRYERFSGVPVTLSVAPVSSS